MARSNRNSPWCASCSGASPRPPQRRVPHRDDRMKQANQASEPTSSKEIRMHRLLARGRRGAAVAVTTAMLLGASVAAHAQKVKLATSAGDIVIELNKAKAPKTVDNFVQYVK